MAGQPGRSGRFGDGRTGGHFGGRKKGSVNKKSEEFQKAVLESGLTPLEYMLNVMRDESAPVERRDDMAKSAAPFLHPRLASIEAKVSVTGHEAALEKLK